MSKQTTIWLLCLGNFIDFYDLTIFSANYHSLLADLFHISSLQQIQALYLQITNYYTLGIIVGCLIFGVIGDKFGRIVVVKYSVLLYSTSILASMFATYQPLFILLRFLSGMGLATEFATVSVLISELFKRDNATKAAAMMYMCGVLGGIAANYLAMISWKMSFFCGGAGGFAIYLLRSKLLESELFISIIHKKVTKGSIALLFFHKKWRTTISLFLLITPFYYLICIMMIYPNLMHLNISHAEATHQLLLGFFIGNLLSVVFGQYIIINRQQYKYYLIISMLFFALFNFIPMFVSPMYFFVYTILLGLLGGGYPTAWMQLSSRSYGINQRSTAANTLYAMGRGSSIVFNCLISYWLAWNNATKLIVAHDIAVLCITVMVIVILLRTADIYNKSNNFCE